MMDGKRLNLLVFIALVCSFKEKGNSGIGFGSVGGRRCGGSGVPYDMGIQYCPVPIRDRMHPPVPS